MSADNWDICPRCLADAHRAVEADRERVMALYGSVSIEEFDAERAALKDVNEENYRSFREDYEIYGASEGEVVASYKGTCSECGLSAEFRHCERFWP